jgi:pimeloyl-ACP methyl ester carboxylesterase
MGSGPRVVFVHGSVTNARSAWAAQLPLTDRFTLVLPDRPGFPPNSPVESLDFEEHGRLIARLLEEGDHVVGHSYGGLISIYAALTRADALRSLTVIEPPAYGIARGRDGVDAFIEALAAHWEHAPRDPRSFLVGFFELIGVRSVELRDPLPPAIEQGARTLMVERPPMEADPPLEELARAPFPKLVVSGAHNPASEALCDVLVERLGAERAVLPGAGHVVQRAPGFNDALVDFLDRAGAQG